MEVGAADETRAVAIRTPIAPVWHTGLLVLLFVSIAIETAVRGPPPVTSSDQVGHAYLHGVLIQLGLLAYVCWPTRVLLRELREGIGFVRVGLEMVSAVLLIVLFLVVSLLVGVEGSAGTTALLPRTEGEKLAWVGVSLSAGFCEELVFRGYLQRQVEALTGNEWLATLLQAVLFGAAHGYKGTAAMISSACFGALMGLVARNSRTLRVGIFCHCMMDSLVLVLT